MIWTVLSGLAEFLLLLVAGVVASFGMQAAAVFEDWRIMVGTISIVVVLGVIVALV